MTFEPHRPEDVSATQPISEKVADEGNIPGPPSSSVVYILAVILGLGLVYLVLTYGPFRAAGPPTSAPTSQSSR